MLTAKVMASVAAALYVTASDLAGPQLCCHVVVAVVYLDN